MLDVASRRKDHGYSYSKPINCLRSPHAFSAPLHFCSIRVSLFSPTHTDPCIYAHYITRSSLAIPIPGLNHHDPPRFLGPMRPHPSSDPLTNGPGCMFSFLYHLSQMCRSTLFSPFGTERLDFIRSTASLILYTVQIGLTVTDPWAVDAHYVRHVSSL